MNSFGVTLLSGGLDSTTVTAYAKERVGNLTALTFNYGQAHSKEIECARRIAKMMDITHRLLDISFLSDVAWYSALTNPHLFPVPQSESTEAIGFGIPITYVPLRNTIFLSLSAALLESEVLSAIEVDSVPSETIEARIYMAPNAIDYSGYPDCRPEYYEEMSKALEYGSKIWSQYGIRIQIETPIIEMSKAEIALFGTKLAAPLDQTWSCYRGDETPCSKCDSCLLRAKGFAEARIPDPLLQRLGR